MDLINNREKEVGEGRERSELGVLFYLIQILLLNKDLFNIIVFLIFHNKKIII